MPVGAPLVGALLYPRLPSPHTHHDPAAPPISRPPSKTRANVLFYIHEPEYSAPPKRPAPGPSRPARQDIPLPSPKTGAAVHSPVPRPESSDADGKRRLLSPRRRHWSPKVDRGRRRRRPVTSGRPNVLSREKKSCPEKSTLDDIGRQMSTSDTLSIPFQATSPPRAPGRRPTHRAQPGRASTLNRGTATAGPPDCCSPNLRYNCQ